MVVNADHSNENMIIDAVGPKIYSFDKLVRLIVSNQAFCKMGSTLFYE